MSEAPTPGAPPPNLPKRVTARLKKEVERPDWGLRLIIAWKATKALFLVLASIACFALAPRHDLRPLAERFLEWFHVNPTNETIEKILSKVTTLSPTKLREIGAGALVFAGFILVEAWGLHRRRVWAEWLTIVATSLLIPVELYELYEKKSLGKLAALVANVLVVIYLMRHRFLFLPGPLGRFLDRCLNGSAQGSPERAPFMPPGSVPSQDAGEQRLT